MQTYSAPRRVRRALAATLAAASAAVGLTACHDLTETPPSFVTPTTYNQTDAQVLSSIASVYNAMRTVQIDVFAVSQVSSDETIVPTRGTDWLDGGQWVELWQHTYGPNSGAGRQNLNNAYSNLSSGIAKANATIIALQTSPAPSAKQALAECRVLRAFFYYELQDLFGGVPLVTTVTGPAQPRATRDSVVRFVEAELLAARPTLPTTQTGVAQGRVTRGSVDAILANLYLNWAVYTGTPSAAGITLGTTTRYADVIARTDSIINSGLYSLNPDTSSWRQMFSAGNQGNRELIFVITNKAASNPNLGLDLPARAVHYNSYSNSGGYNGYSTIVETYNQFDSTDSRKNVFLVGNQTTLDTHAQAFLRDGKTPLVFSSNITSINAAAENEGIRWYKFKLDPGHSNDENGVDFPIFRLGGVLLDRAEAMWQMGQSGPALAILNQLRARNYNPPQPITAALDANLFLHERLNELAFEGKRRQDMIRLGAFGGQRRFKTTTDAGFQAVFPIPTPQLQANPLLKQNPGY
ncbi:MAG TPA: RagB/SusD family nutrient uptake outer membrane protein [Gemmatirosa sp.]